MRDRQDRNVLVPALVAVVVGAGLIALMGVGGWAALRRVRAVRDEQRAVELARHEAEEAARQEGARGLVDAHRRALDADPDDADALSRLRQSLPPGEKGELADRLARARDPGALFDELYWEAQDEGDEAGAEALLAGLRKARPDDHRVAEHDVRRMVEAGDFDGAAARLRAWLAGDRSAGDQDGVLFAYLDAMTTAGRPLDGYAAVPDVHASRAFDILAQRLGGMTISSQGPRLDQLAGLIAAHRKRDPDDPWLRFYEAARLHAAGEFEKAEAVYADGAARLEKRPPRKLAPPFPGAPEDFDLDRERFRYHRVECLYELKQGLKAYAEVGPPSETFRQLAHRYSAAKDVAGLTALLAAHERRFPDDQVLTFWRAEVHYLKGEYAAAAAGFGAYRRAPGESDPERFLALDRQVRSLVRAGDAAAADEVLGEVHPDQVPPILRVVVAAAFGDVDALDRLLAEWSSGPSGLFGLYIDPDFARLIAADRFADLRAKYPDPRPKRPAGPKD